MLFRTFLLSLVLLACNPEESSNDDDVEIVDKDGDGFPFEEDCNDSDASIYPGAPESCEEPLVDSNCDGAIGGLDEDEDGYRACDDCDDADSTRHPGAVEICDTIDNDCDGDIDDDDSSVDLSTVPEVYVDNDEDGFGDEEQPIVQCEPPEKTSPEAGDCDDSDSEIHPNAEEICDLKDNNCNGVADRDDDTVIITDTDPVCFIDIDDDGYGDESAEGIHTCFCLPQESDNNRDCNDAVPEVNPDADYSEEPASDGTWDLDCDGDVDKEYPDGGGFCQITSDGRYCDFADGYADMVPECGESALFITACLAKKTTAGMVCEKSDEYRIQACK